MLLPNWKVKICITSRNVVSILVTKNFYRHEKGYYCIRQFFFALKAMEAGNGP